MPMRYHACSSGPRVNTTICVKIVRQREEACNNVVTKADPHTGSSAENASVRTSFSVSRATTMEPIAPVFESGRLLAAGADLRLSGGGS